MLGKKINLIITITCNWKPELCNTETFWNRFLDSNRQRKTPTVIRHLLSSPRHLILNSNIFFYVKLFATIILSWNSLKCILWYLLELSDPFIKNENSALLILIEKKFEQKIYFCLLKMRCIFFLREKIHFFKLNLEITEIIFSTSREKFKIFPFILFKKRRLAHGIRRPKAADSPLLFFICYNWKKNRVLNFDLKNIYINTDSWKLHCIGSKGFTQIK